MAQPAYDGVGRVNLLEKELCMGLQFGRRSGRVMAIFLAACTLVACAGGDRISRQENDVPTYGAQPYGYGGSDIHRQQYGPSDRAGNPAQNGLPPYSNCQFTTRC